ncbi:MAG: hypothetical protein PGN11_16240 [Quadrisphaera sp.]
MTNYDPAVHADALQVQVIRKVLRSGRWGAYDHRCRTVYLVPGLTSRQERATLAHEVVHAEHEDHVIGDGWWDARTERRADETAARRLVHGAALERAMMLHPDDPAAVAEELDVPRWLLLVALRMRAAQRL